MGYTGQVAHIPFGQLGLLTDVPPGDVPRGAFIKANNVSFETGSITKAPGSLRYNTQVLPASVCAVIDYWPTTSTQRMIAACTNGSLYRDIGDRLFSDAVAINSGLMDLTPKCQFVTGGQEVQGNNKKLFLFSGTNQLYVLSGDADEFFPAGNPAADWTTPNYPKFGFVHQARLWAFMGQRAYASDTADHENFVSNNLTFAIYPGEGGEIVGGFVFKGRAFVFKEGGFVYYLDDQDPDDTNWVWRKLASNFGLASPNGIVQVLDDMIAANETGSLISYNATQAFGDIESADMLRILQIEDYFRKATNNAGLEYLHALYYEAKKQLFFTWRSTYRTTNDMLFHVDFNKQSPRAAFWTKDSAECLALRKGLDKVQRPIYGSSDGYIYLMDREDRLVGGSAFTGSFKTGHMDFRWMDERFAHKNKIFDYLAIEFIPQGEWNLSVDVFIDGKFSETINYLMDVRDDGLDTFTLGSGSGGGITTPTGGNGDPLGREESQTVQMPLHGSGRRISFEFRQSGANQNFSIPSIDVGFRPSGEQATRV